MMQTTRPLHGGQVTIPDEFQRELGIGEDDVLQLTLVNGELRIRPIHRESGPVGSEWLRQAYDLFAPVREEAIEAGYTEEEINSAIADAIAAARSQRA